MLDLSLAVTRQGRATVPPVFDPGFSNLRIWYETPLGERRRHRSPFMFCRSSVGEPVTVARNRPLQHNPRVGLGHSGLNFTVPGTYRMWADFEISKSRIVRSNTVQFDLCLPRTDAEKAISPVLCDPMVSFFVAHKGGRLPARRRRRLVDLAKAYPQHASLQHVRYALGVDYRRQARYSLARAMLRNLRAREDSVSQGVDSVRRALG